MQPIDNIINSGLTYGGAPDIKTLQRKLNYTVITQAGYIECLPHKEVTT